MGVWHLSKNFPITSRRGFARLMGGFAAGLSAASSGAAPDLKAEPGSSGYQVGDSEEQRRWNETAHAPGHDGAV